jgi:hypothetical protein
MKRAEPGWFVLTLAGFAALLGSFLPFYTYAEGVDVTVWSRGLFPTAALIPLLGFVIGLQALFVLIVGHEPRSPFLNFTWEQVRLAVGTIMILLALSYLLQDRAGGSLGSGYLVLSLASLVIFAGGVMTRRAQLARAGEAAARKRQLRVKPALAAVSRAGAGLARNVGALGRSAANGTANFGRSAARGTAALGRNAKARVGFGQPNDAKQGATLDAELDGNLGVQPPPPPPGTLVDELPEEPPPPPPGTLVDKLPEESPPPPPETLVDKLPEGPVGATPKEQAEATTEQPVEEIADETVVATEAITEQPGDKADEPTEEIAEQPGDKADEPTEEIAEQPGDKADEPTEEIVKESARVATLSAVPPEAGPDESTPPDGDTPPPAHESPDGADKVAGSKPKSKRRRRPAKKVAKKVEPTVQQTVEENESADDDKEPQRPAAPG